MNSVLSQRCPMKLGFLLGDTVNKQSRREMGFLQRDLAKLSADLDLDHIYIAPGNHDVGVGPYSAERDIFSENFGKGFRSFVFKNNLFIILDAGLDGWNISGEQLNMLKRLESSNKQYKNIFIFSHQLIWLKANNEFKGLIPNDLSEKGGLEINFWTEVFPILKNLKGRKFFISGDVGLFRNGSEFFYNKYDDFNFIATGMGSGSRDNYLIFHINEGKPNVEFITF